MTSVPPTQPPAAPETYVSALGDVEAEVARARAPRVSSCCYEVGTSRCRCVPMCHIPADRVAALLERVRVVEAERDGWRDRAATNRDGWRQMLARAESAEAAHRALQAAVEALADEWEADFMAYRHEDPAHLRIRALLAGGDQ